MAWRLLLIATMGASVPHAHLALTPSTRNLVAALAFLSMPALGCVVSLDGLTGGDGSKADAGAGLATSSSSGGGESPGSSEDAGTTPQGSQMQPPPPPDATSPSRGDDGGSLSTGSGSDDAGTGTGSGSGSAGAVVFGAPTSASPTIGESTGTSFSETCPAGAALVGLNLVSDTDSPFSLFQVQPICAEIDVAPSGALSFAAPVPLVLEGDDGGDEEAGTLACPTGTVVTGISATAEKYVHSVVIQCQILAATPASGGGFAITLGNATVEGPFGNTSGGYSTFTYQCPSSSVANALAGTAGGAGFLDSIVLGCATPSSP